MIELKLCERGEKLYRWYCAAADKYGWNHPIALDACQNWVAHKRGCPACSGLKSKGESDET